VFKSIAVNMPRFDYNH